MYTEDTTIIPTSVLSEVIEKYPDVNVNWIYTGIVDKFPSCITQNTTALNKIPFTMTVKEKSTGETKSYEILFWPYMNILGIEHNYGADVDFIEIARGEGKEVSEISFTGLRGFLIMGNENCDTEFEEMKTKYNSL